MQQDSGFFVRSAKGDKLKALGFLGGQLPKWRLDNALVGRLRLASRFHRRGSP